MGAFNFKAFLILSIYSRLLSKTVAVKQVNSDLTF